jgi:hypothetical protein
MPTLSSDTALGREGSDESPRVERLATLDGGRHRDASVANAARFRNPTLNEMWLAHDGTGPVGFDYRLASLLPGLRVMCIDLIARPAKLRAHVTTLDQARDFADRLLPHDIAVEHAFAWLPKSIHSRGGCPFRGIQRLDGESVVRHQRTKHESWATGILRHSQLDARDGG